VTYEEMRMRCNRIIGLSPDAPEAPIDCVKLLGQYYNDSGRAIAAEMLARELAEFIHLHRPYLEKIGTPSTRTADK